MLTYSRTSLWGLMIVYINNQVDSYFRKAEKHTPNSNIARTDLSSRGLDGTWQTRHPSEVAVRFRVRNI